MHPIHEYLCYVQLNLIFPTVLESHRTPPASTTELWFVTGEKAHLGDRNSSSSGHAQAVERKLVFLCHFSLLYPRPRSRHAYCMLRTVPYTPVYTQKRDQGGSKAWKNVTEDGAECSSNFKYKITKIPPIPQIKTLALQDWTVCMAQEWLAQSWYYSTICTPTVSVGLRQLTPAAHVG